MRKLQEQGEKQTEKEIAKLKEQLMEIEIGFWKKDEERDPRPNSYRHYIICILPWPDTLNHTFNPWTL